MRILLEKEKQIELIEKAKNRNNFSWRELAKKINLSPRYLRVDLKRGEKTLVLKSYETLCMLAKENFSNSVITVLDDNWGRRLGGKNSPSKPKKPKILTTEYSKDLAEFFGILFGDGNCFENPSKGIYQIKIFGHAIDEYEYMTKYISPLFQKLFRIVPSIQCRPNTKALVLSKQSKDLVFTLKQFGLKPGNKKSNGLEIPGWIWNNKDFLKAFVRGLIDTDGSVYPKTRNHKTPTIWFSSASPTIRQDLNKAFKILGYRLSVWTPRKGFDCMQCSMGQSTDVWRYYQEIGFSNPKHANRFKKYWRAPII